MKAKVGIVEWGLPESGPNAIEIAKEYGLSCIQLNFTRDYEIKSYISKISSVSHSSGVSISAIALNILNEYQLSGTSSGNFNPPHKIFSAALKAAITLRVNHIFIPSFYTGAISSNEDIIRLSLFYKWACSLAMESQIIISTENVLSIEKAVELYRLVNHTNFRFIFDPFNYLTNNIDPIEIHDKLGDIFHKQVHIKNGDNTKSGIRKLDDGLFNLKDILIHTCKCSTFYLENKYHVIGCDKIQHDLEWLLGIFNKLDKHGYTSNNIISVY